MADILIYVAAARFGETSGYRMAGEVLVEGATGVVQWETPDVSFDATRGTVVGTIDTAASAALVAAGYAHDPFDDTSTLVGALALVQKEINLDTGEYFQITSTDEPEDQLVLQPGTGFTVGIGDGSLLQLIPSAGGGVQIGGPTSLWPGITFTGATGFFGATAVVQPAAVANATTSIDVITRLNELLARLRTLGLIAT